MVNKNKDQSRGGPVDTLVKKLLISIDPDKKSEYNLMDRGNEFKDIINSELELTKGMSDGSIVDFSRSIAAGMASNKNKGTSKDSVEITDDLLTYINKNTSSLFQDFSENDRNRYIEYRDYNFITAFVPKVSQAIRLILTHVVSSDDLSGQFTRNHEYGAALSEEHKNTLSRAIAKYEDENKLLDKLKNIVFRETFVMGSYFVYAISYQKLFQNYAAALAKKKQAMGLGNKSLGSLTGSLFSACESVVGFDKDETSVFDKKFRETEIITNEGIKVKALSNEYGEMASVKCVTSDIPVFFDGDIDTLGQQYETVLEAAAKDGKISNRRQSKKMAAVTDATYSESNDSFNVCGTFIKFISCRNMVPVTILDNTVGYFYVASSTIDKTKQTLSIGNINIATVKKSSPIEEIARALTDKVAKQFSDKFVGQNSQFKKLIAECIMADGVTNTEFKIQFIPAEYVKEFKINEDANGRGQSLLKDAKQPAKTLAAVTMRKTLNYINKSGDKTIMTVKGGYADVSRKNQAMRIIRNMQEQNIVVSDIMGDTNNIFHKYSADSNILMPTSKSGQKLVELEKLDGQQIDMNVEWEKEKENEVLLAMGVPPLLIEQYNQADFAKAFTSAHVGFAGIVAGWQSDFETPTTELYKEIIRNLDIPEEIKEAVLPVYHFKLPRPRYVSVQTASEAIQSAMQTVETYIQLRLGDNIQDNEKDAIQKAKFDLVKELAPCVPWERYDDIFKKAYITAVKVKDEVKDTDVSMDAGGDDF